MNPNSDWKSLYKACGWAAWILLVYSLATMAILLALGTPPTSAAETFSLLQANRLAGLLRLDLLTVLVYMPLFYVIFLGLYIALKNSRPVHAVVVVLLGCAGVTLFLATPSVFSWIALSDRFAAATSEAQKSLSLAAGEALLVSDMWHGTGATVGSILIQFAATLASVAMVSGAVFGKGTAYVGIATHGLDLARILLGFFFPAIGIGLMAIAGTLYLVWFPLLALDFFKLGKGEA